ncbi:PREDICTED: glutamate receptor U1-like [Polistes dominula]|uniref:Glutamate receptor U1-like n=1 Tax=Polistes dominula TaxID=743375 RepID=A0ABM1HW04_POLDO|nr:PREDICTED: glutamate receptor U1-like [Polistes dominula]
MVFIYFTSLFLMIQAETCLRLLNNQEESRILKKSPGRIWRWDRIANNFVPLETLKSNNGLLCSVDFVKDLTMKSITVVSDYMNPYIIINSNQSRVTGFIGDVWTTLEETLKFTYALFVQSEGTSVSTWWYVRIFSYDLWRIIGLFIIFIVFIIMGIYALRKTVYRFYVECDNEFSSLSFVFLYVLGGISGQGCQKIPSCWSLRLIILSFLIMGMLLFCGFSSTLTSYLTIGITSVPITSLEDIANKRTHILCVRNDSGAYIHFTVDGIRNEELLPEWKNLVNKNCPDTMDIHTISSKLCNPGFVYLEGPDIFLSIYQPVINQCRYVRLPQEYWSLKLAFQHARSSEYRKVIDLYLIRLRSVGILDYLEKKWLKREWDNTLGQSEWTDFRAVEYGHIRVVFLILSIATVFSALICVGENIFYKWQIRSQRKISCVTAIFKDKVN